MTTVLIAAVDMTEDHEPCLDIYTATSREEAEAFIAAWNAKEKKFAQEWGGYPGLAIVAEPNGSSEPELLAYDDDHTAEVWLSSQT